MELKDIEEMIAAAKKKGLIELPEKNECILLCPEDLVDKYVAIGALEKGPDGVFRINESYFTKEGK